jgi:hypothetical protein
MILMIDNIMRIMTGCAIIGLGTMIFIYAINLNELGLFIISLIFLIFGIALIIRNDKEY